MVPAAVLALYRSGCFHLIRAASSLSTDPFATTQNFEVHQHFRDQTYRNLSFQCPYLTNATNVVKKFQLDDRQTNLKGAEDTINKNSLQRRKCTDRARQYASDTLYNSISVNEREQTSVSLRVPIFERLSASSVPVASHCTIGLKFEQSPAYLIERSASGQLASQRAFKNVCSSVAEVTLAAPTATTRSAKISNSLLHEKTNKTSVSDVRY